MTGDKRTGVWWWVRPRADKRSSRIRVLTLRSCVAASVLGWSACSDAPTDAGAPSSPVALAPGDHEFGVVYEGLVGPSTTLLQAAEEAWSFFAGRALE